MGADASNHLVAGERPPWSPWDDEYASTSDRFIWGTRASNLARAVTTLLGGPARVLDLGCGEGHDSVFLAEQGHDVIGLELSLDGLRKAARLAADQGVHVPWVCSAMPDVPVRGLFDLFLRFDSLCRRVSRLDHPQAR